MGSITNYFQKDGFFYGSYKLIVTTKDSSGAEIKQESIKEFGPSYRIISTGAITDIAPYDVKENSMFFNKDMVEDGKSAQKIKNMFYMLSTLPRGLNTDTEVLRKVAKFFDNPSDSIAAPNSFCVDITPCTNIANLCCGNNIVDSLTAVSTTSSIISLISISSLSLMAIIFVLVLKKM
jgi:hypothetical protein